MSDEIIKKLWEIKDSIAHEHGYNTEMLVAYLRKRKRPVGRRIVDLSVQREKDDQGDPVDSSGYDGSNPGDCRGLGRQ